jgi:HEAT repeat protein
VTGAAQAVSADLTLWSFWWEFNKEPYLNLKSHLHTQAVAETGSDNFFTGLGDKGKSKESLKPTDAQIREKVVPALLNALKTEKNNDIVTGCLVALAKIGDVKSESGKSAFEEEIRKFLSDSNQEISETAAVALGILSNPASIPTLESLLRDTADGRKLVNRNEVLYRTRSFAAYGLGLIGARVADEATRKSVVKILREAVETDDTKSRDLKVSAIVAMGLVPLETIDTATGEDAQLAETSRTAQLDFLLRFFNDDTQEFLVRAHCPTAMARLLADMPAAQGKVWRDKVAGALLDRVTEKKKDQAEVVQSCVLALGLFGTNGSEDAKIREALAGLDDKVKDIQANNFAMIALAKMGGRPGEADMEAGINEVSKVLLTEIAKGKDVLRPWAGLGIGVMGNMLTKAQVSSPVMAEMSDALRTALEDEKDKSRLAAYAIGAGILGDVESEKILLDKLNKVTDDEARGYVAIALGLMNTRSAVEPIQAIITESKYRPTLLKQAAIGLGLLGDKDLVPNLIQMLADAKGLATQAAISSALGFIGDARSIDPLVEMLQNKDITERARGFAAVALGIVADKETLPWNTKIAIDLNYRASTQTLVDAQGGTGILDIL